MTRDEWVKAIRDEVEKRIKEYEALPLLLRANGVARLACECGWCADVHRRGLSAVLAELAAANAHLVPRSEP